MTGLAWDVMQTLPSPAVPALEFGACAVSLCACRARVPACVRARRTVRCGSFISTRLHFDRVTRSVSISLHKQTAHAHERTGGKRLSKARGQLNLF